MKANPEYIISSSHFVESTRQNTVVSAWVFLFFFSLLIAALTPAPACGDESQLPADVRVVIDVSGSMKQNDPNNLRQPALELLVKLLPEGSKAGVWTFGKYVNMLVPHRQVNAEWREQATLSAAKINSTGLYTNIGGALEKAAYDVASGNQEYRTTVILLTDGVVDVSREPEDNQSEWRRIVDKVLPGFEKADYTIHTIALSDNADTDLMNKLALSTDGIAAVANSADELLQIFLSAFDNAAPAEQLPFEGNTFVVDSSIEEFTALIFREPGSSDALLRSPDRTEYSALTKDPDLSWYQDPQYDLITVKKPLEGEWQVQAELAPDSRITVVSNLNLIVKPLKNNIFKDDQLTLSALLQENGKTINDPKFLELVSVSYQLTHKNEEWQASLSEAGTPDNGIYQTELQHFEQEGEYQLQLVVDGKSFQRSFSHTVVVREPFGVSADKKTIASQTHEIFTVRPFGQTIDLTKTQVVARVRTPSGTTDILPLTLTEVDNWELDYVPDQEGDYDVAISINAVDKSGREFSLKPRAMRFRYPDGDDPFQVSKPEPEPEPEPVTPAMPEPEPEPETAMEPEQPTEPVRVTVENETATEEESSSVILYAALALGNIMVLALAFVAYKIIIGRKSENQLEDLEKAIENADQQTQDKLGSESSPKDRPPSMADMGSEADVEKEAPTLVSIRESEPVAEPPPPMDLPEDESAEGEDQNNGPDVEFSLDDFSTDDDED